MLISKNFYREIHGINEQKELDKEYWIKEALVPLFYRNKDYYSYETQAEMMEDTLSLELNKGGVQEKRPVNVLVAASTGWGKTRTIKNIVKWAYKIGYNILVVEPKSYEFVNMKYKGEGKKLAPQDKNEKFARNIQVCSPLFTRPFIRDKFPEREKEITFYSPDIKALNNADSWIGLGIPPKAANEILSYIHKGDYNLKSWGEKLKKHKTMHPATKNAALTALENLESSSFFSSEVKDLKLDKYWEKKKIVIVNYHNQRTGNMMYDIGLLIGKAMQIGQQETRKGLSHVTKKLIILDDAFYYAGSDASSFNKTTEFNLAATNISHSQNNARTWGLNMIIIVQNLSKQDIFPNLIDGCTSKLLGSIEHTEPLRGKIPDKAFALLSNTNPEKGPILFSDETKYLKQWIVTKTRTDFETGIAYDCSLGHGK